MGARCKHDMQLLSVLIQKKKVGLQNLEPQACNYSKQQRFREDKNKHHLIKLKYIDYTIC